MSTATKSKNAAVTQNLAKPTVCKKCTATHFTYTLTCKRCGDYLDKRDAVLSEGNQGKIKLAASMVAVMIGILLACLIFRAL